LLLEAAGRQPGVEKSPAPEVKFESFVAEGMRVVLTVYVASGTAAADQIRTDLAFAVHRAMKAAGMENPMQRHNVRLQDLEPIRQAVFAAMEERRRKESAL